MFAMTNGATVLRADLRAEGGHPQGIVLAQSERDYVVWNIAQDDNGWHAWNGHYFPVTGDSAEARFSARQRAIEAYDRRRGV